MIKLLDDLLIAATCCPTVPGSIVAGLREVADIARRGDGNPAGTPGAKVDLSRLDASPATVRVARADLPPPFDSQEEAQRAAGLWPSPQPVTDNATSASLMVPKAYRVCLAATPQGHQVGAVEEVPPGADWQVDPQYWAWCDKDGWVPPWIDKPIGMKVEDIGRGWRPVRQPTTGRADAVPKPSALDEMAEQVRRWAVPTTQPALAVQEGGSHYKSMKIQPVEYIHANGLGYFEGNVVKYVSRWRSKGGLQDLKKARHYLDLLIELEGGTK